MNPTASTNEPVARCPLVIDDRQRAALWRYLRTLGAAPDEADDLVQEAALVALRRSTEIDQLSPGSLFAFLRTTARQLHWRRARPRRIAERELVEADAVWDARCGADADGCGDDYLDALRACLEQLPQRSRQLLQQTYAEGEGRAAAGRALGIGSHGVKSALRRLRAFLHTCIRTRLSR